MSPYYESLYGRCIADADEEYRYCVSECGSYLDCSSQCRTNLDYARIGCQDERRSNEGLYCR